MTSTARPGTIPELFFNRVRKTPHQTAVLFKKRGTWRPMTWRGLEDAVRGLARVIADSVQAGEIVSILSENRPEWWIADLAVLALGGVTAPIYTTNPPKDVAYILNDCEARLLFLSGAEQLAKVRKLREQGAIPKLQRVVVFDEVELDDPRESTLSSLLAQKTAGEDPIPSRLCEVKPDDLATLIYTSGTTGEPKGVMLSHNNLVSNVLASEVVVEPLDLEERLMLSFLPLSHSFERTCGYYAAIHYGFKVAFAESIEKLVDNLGEVRPTLLASVPRIYEKLYARVMQGAQSGLKRLLLDWSLGVGKQVNQYFLADRPLPLLLRLQHEVAHRLIFSKLHERLGGRLRFAVSGGAPLAPEIAEFLNAIGFYVFEGYGLSETSPGATMNRKDAVRIGSVGKVLPGVEIKIEPEPDRQRDGEILIRGPNVMMGYYKKPEATAEVLGEDGWFRTGDIGYIDEEGFLYITDRKKELLKTAGGKYVAPAPIENRLKTHPLVEQAVVIGDRRKYCIALLVPDFEALQGKLGRTLPADRSGLNDDPQVRELYQQVIDEVNRDLGRWEQAKRFHLLPREMTQETGELTPTLKLKRRVIDEKHRAVIDSLYPTD